MKRYSPLVIVMALISLSAGCATNQSTNSKSSNYLYKQTIVSTTKETYPAKNPKTVAVYSKNKLPHTAYRVIGVATVAKRNVLGLQRQDETMHEIMKKLAASIGGDGLMNIQSDEKGLQANVIAFQKILI